MGRNTLVFIVWAYVPFEEREFVDVYTKLEDAEERVKQEQKDSHPANGITYAIGETILK